MWTKESLQRLVRRELGNYHFIVVSNRQPYIHNMVDGDLQCMAPAGGMTTAIDSLMQASGGTWIAHGAGSGDRYAVDKNDQIKVPLEAPAYSLRLVWLTEEQERGYYHGLSNEALWPLCHIAYTEPAFDARDWNTYKLVNQKFARQVLDKIDGRPAVVLTQDYHLALLPRLLKNANPNIVTGQFWHIPWPNQEVFRIFPWKEELIDGLLGNDLLGFHMQSHCENFLDTAYRNLESEVDHKYNLIRYDQKVTMVRPFPISVDFEQINQEAQTDEVSEEMKRLTDELGLGDKLIGIGIDRIDYTKGIPNRFRAIGRFLEKCPRFHSKVVFIQAGVISRGRIGAYQQLSDQIEQLLEEINGRFGHGGWQPIIYMPIDLPDITLMALKRLARFCVVSSLHDGMNLVAKEFVASRTDEDGILILSPFTGAAQELTEALIVNPYATEHFADAIETAMVMPYEERHKRMLHMRAIVQENNIYKWAARLLVDLMESSRTANQPHQKYRMVPTSYDNTPSQN
jgi:alpha,alpha-trehalose-phosphate synthase [UDP-forming]